MNWERWRIPIMIGPTVLILFVLFFSSLGYGLLQSFGYQPGIGKFDLNLSAYLNILTSDEYAQYFWPGLGLTLWISFTSTVVSAVLAIIGALLLRNTFIGKRVVNFIFQLSLPVPHIVAAVGMMLLLSQSGLFARFAASMNLISVPSEFPEFVNDPWGIGIIAAYVWKEIPFFGIIILAVLQTSVDDYEAAARVLGANRLQCFFRVTLPMIMPAILSSSIIVFAFNFGAYEVPKLLGMRYPAMLPVLTVEFFQNPDLNARAEGMAMSMIIAFLIIFLVVVYMRLLSRQKQTR